MNCAPTSYRRHDNELAKFANEFIKIGQKFNIKNLEHKVRQIEIRLGELEASQFAVCYPYFNEVVVNIDGWEELPIENKEEIVFHELTHCALGKLEHLDYGIMKESGLHSPSYYRNKYKSLINNLFDCETSNCVEITWDQYKYGIPKGKQLTKADILNNKHAVVRFTATWCPPCKALAPIFDEVAAAHPDVKVYVVDVDVNQDLAREMNIRGIPTMIQIKDNSVTDTRVGAQTKEKVEELFK